MYFGLYILNYLYDMDATALIEARKKRGEALRRTRKLLRITKSYLAAATGLSRNTIDNIEHAKTAWNIDTEAIYLSGLEIEKCKN